MLTSAISLKKTVEALEKELILKAMKENNGVIAKAARQLDLTERILSYKIKKYQIPRDRIDYYGFARNRHSRESGNPGRTSQMEMTAIVLAGGESLRMGKDKAFMEFKGKSLIQRTLDTLIPLFNDRMIIAKKREPFLSFGVPVYVDIYPDGGPMGGIYTGLFQSKGPVFAVACDMPFLNPEVIRFLTEKLNHFDAVVLKSPDGLHPLHGVYSRGVLPSMEKLLKKREVKMMDFLKRINTLVIPVAEIRHLDPDLKCLTNINTPEEMNLIRSLD